MSAAPASPNRRSLPAFPAPSCYCHPMYTTLLALHSWIRWIALVAAVGTTLAALRGKTDGPRSLADRWGMIAMMVLDTQLLLGQIGRASCRERVWIWRVGV